MKFSTMKRILSMILCVTMIVSAFTAITPVAAVSEVNVQNGTGTRSAVQVTGSYSYRAYLNGPFEGFAFAMPTWNTANAAATLYLYKWQGSYSATVASTPVAQRTFNPLSDNAYHWVTFPTQPEGEYLFHIDNVSGEAGVWTNTGTSNSMGHMYLNGTEQSYQPDLVVRFADSNNASFGYCRALTAQMVCSPTGTQSALKMDSPMGVRVTTTAPFIGMITKLATYGSTDIDADLSVYAWKGSYAATVAAEPVASQRMRLRDNAEHEIRFDKQPAGEYLFLVENYSKTPAMYVYSGASNFKGYVYKDCYPWTSGTQYPVMYVVFDEERSSYYTNCSAMGDTISGTHTPPSEYVIPSDSLIYTHEVMPDTWVFTDGLGRTSLTYADVGAPRSGKTLAMFYWDWHIDYFLNENPVNLQELSEKYPETTMRDWESSLWNSLGSSTFWWNESIYGFYSSSDKWVLRKQAELLANAGVDVIFTDNTNAEHTWANAYIPLMEEWSDAMEDGLKAPKISFMFPFYGSGTTVDESYTNTQLRSIYLNVYRSGRFHNLWFYWKGKPMVMGQQGAFMTGTAVDNEIKNFFTFRTGHSGYKGGSTNGSTWGWCSMFPQGLHGNGSTTEQITVSVSQNYDYVNGTLAAMNGTIVSGRSTYCTNPTSATGNYSYTSKYTTQGAEASKWGYNFAQQFDYALAVDPSVIFVTGWNEFRVGRYHNWPGGTPTTTENGFPDQYNDEHSRDIEPTKGDLADHYYYQLVNFVRRYKGVRPIPTPTTAKAIDLNGDVTQWDSVGPYYAAYIDNIEDRDAAGYGNLHYTETSGRNDIIGAKIARNSQYVTFLVECNEDITPYTDSLWMNLYIDTNQNNQGWNTFEYVVNKSAASADTLVLEKFTTANSYDTVKVTDVEYKVDGRYMTVKIPKSALGLSGSDYTINFTWTDNVHDEGNYSTFSGDIMDFYVSGDVAPGGRFKYSYISTTANTGADDPDDTNPGGGNEGGDTPGGEIGDIESEPVIETISTGTRTNTPYSSITNKKIGQRYNIGDKVLKNISIINLATFDDGNVNTWSFKVWQWKGSYSATVNGTPLYTKTGSNHVNCQTMSMDIPTSLAIMGDIYYEVQYLSGSGSFTGWKASGSLPGALQTYIDGTQVVDSYASTFTVVDTVWEGEIIQNSFNGKYHANVDTVNGKGPGTSSAYTYVGASTLRSNGNPTGRDAVVDGITVSEDTYTVLIGGWMAVEGGIHHYAYSICGSNLITAAGGKNGEPLSNYYAGSLGISNALQNGLFNDGAELVADLSAYAGHTVSVTFYAIPQADQTKAIAIMTIHNLAVPEKEEPETEPPTEPETEPPTEPETEPPTEPETEPPTEPETEPPTEPETEPPTEPETEPPTEPETEPPTEPETEPLKSYSITINSPKEYTVTLNGETEYYVSEIRESLLFGTEVTMTVTDTAHFAYWRDGNNKIVSRDPTLHVIVTGADEYVAVFNTKLTGKVTVIYESYYEQIIARTQLSVSGAKKWTAPATPTRYGYLCEGWSLEGDALVGAIEKALATETPDDDVIVVTPVYILPEASAEVVVVNGAGSGVYQVNNFVTIRANAPAAGMKFAYWADETGTVLSYRTDYQFFLTKNVTYTAVYVPVDTAIDPKGLTTVLEVTEDAANGKMIFVSWSVVPQNYKIVKAGVIVTTDKTVGESGDGFNADTALRIATGTTDAGQLRYTYSVKSSKVVYVRAYLVCSDADGVIHTVYGETVSASLAD